MPRKSGKGTEKLEAEENAEIGKSTESLESNDDAEKTMIEQPSTAELREEILQMKDSLKFLMEKLQNTNLTTQVQQPNVSDILPTTTATLPAVATSQIYTPPLLPASMPPMQQFSLSEYKMPYSYNIPNTAAHELVQTTVPLPLLSSQPATPFQPQSSAYTSFVQPQSTQIFTNTAPRMTPSVSLNYLPSYYQNVAMTVSAQQAADRQVNRELRRLHDLPEFSGQPERWPKFNVAYNETTRNYNYTNLENLMRLQKALKGDAKTKVETFLIHPDSVGQVMATLEFHYGRPEVLIRSQIAKVRAFPQITGRKMYELVNFSTMVSNLTAFLENANATPHLSNPTLIEELVNKLPPYKKEEWMKHSLQNLGHYPSVRQFSTWLQEVATYIALATKADKTDAHCNKKDKMNPSFTITMENRLTKCLLCQQNHKLYQCNNFKELTTSDRWKFVKGKNLCFCCLLAGHNLQNCRTKRQCGLSKCFKYHNRLLHENNKVDNYENKNNKGKTAVNNNDVLVREDTRSINVENENSVVNAIVDNSFNTETLFKYLPVKLRGPKGSIEILAFMDDGSKISLLEEEVANKIGLKGLTNHLRLGWIGGKTTNEVSKKVDFEIRGSEKNKEYFNMRKVFTTKNLELPPQSLNLESFRKQFPVLNKMRIEDYINAAPKMLIGLPHIRLVRPLDVVNLDECFAVHRTNLGNILFGSNEDSTEATVCKIDVEF